jgi:hypothetical protein
VELVISATPLAPRTQETQMADLPWTGNREVDDIAFTMVQLGAVEYAYYYLIAYADHGICIEY